MNSRILIAAVFSFIFFGASAQDSAQDTIQTQSPTYGPIFIHPVSHASFVLSTANVTIYVDPTGGADAFNGTKDPDMIIITDIHGDHFDSATIAAVKGSNTIVVAPKAVADKINFIDQGKLMIMNNGQNISLNVNARENSGVSITAVPMYNLPETADSRHPKGRGNGYVITLGGKKIYISGDTEDITEMRNLKNIDIAFVCMNLPYTMDIKQAASAVLAFKPAIVYPYHYRGDNGLSDVNAFKKMVNSSNPKIEVRLKEWYPGR